LEYTGNKQRFDRIEFFLKLQKDKLDKDYEKNPNSVKEEIIKIFKSEKMDVTNILQGELKEQVQILNKEIVKINIFNI
jgi:hypothetical protein